jgi:hypothetical protein
MFERFTDRARRVLVLAQEEARLLDHSFIGTEHILLGLIAEGEGLAAKALESLGISLEAVRAKVDETIGPAGNKPSGSPAFTPRAKKVLELALREALQLGHNYIGTEHILLGVVREGEGVAAQVLQSLGADLDRVRRQVIKLVSGFEGRQPEGGATLAEPVSSGFVFWRHPTKVIPGPEATLSVEGVEFSVIGVLLYAAGFEIIWRLSGVPGPLNDLVSGSDVITGNAYIQLSDYNDTQYACVSTTFDSQSGSEWAGRSAFIPSVDAEVHRLIVVWQDELLDVNLLPPP